MNWKRGLFRLWIFVSLLWLVGAGSIAVLENSPLQQQHRARTAAESAACDAELFLDAPDSAQSPDFLSGRTRLDTTGLTSLCAAPVVEWRRAWGLPYWWVTSGIIGAPGLVLGLGLSIVWVALGFYESRQTQAGN